jgi:hypothetical protein
MITCPTSGRAVSTGIFTDQADFSRLSHLPGCMRCPACGEHHQWAISYAWLEPVALEVGGASANSQPSASPIE